MKIIEKKLNIDPAELKLLDKYLSTNSYAVFDIETTGLSPSFSSIVLAGFVLVKDGTASLIQYFAETPMQEKEVLGHKLATSEERRSLGEEKIFLHYDSIKQIFD